MRTSSWMMATALAIVVGAIGARAGTAPVTPPPAATATNAVKMQAACPIMAGQPINKKLYVDFEGKRIYVCCQGCIGEVRKDPAKYIKQLAAEGVTLDKTPEPAPAK